MIREDGAVKVLDFSGIARRVVGVVRPDVIDRGLSIATMTRGSTRNAAVHGARAATRRSA